MKRWPFVSTDSRVAPAPTPQPEEDERSLRMTEDEIHARDWWCPHCREAVPPEMVTYDETHYLEGGGCGHPVRAEIKDAP
jgi:hypothetical protein